MLKDLSIQPLFVYPGILEILAKSEYYGIIISNQMFLI